MRDFFHFHDPVSFVFPIDGDCLNINDGRTEGDALYVKVKVRAAENAVLTVNGISAAYDENERLFYAEVPVYGYRNSLYAVDSYNGARADIVVYRLYDPMKKFYFTVDDVIIFLYDLTKSPDKYPSIFDHPFLSPFKTAHELYGAHVHFNLYYEFTAEDSADFADHKEYFNLSMMTDRYRPEFEANSDWLTFSFHANSNYPDKPAVTLSPAFFGESMRKTHKEIRRFAGERALIPATTMHWGNCYMDVQRVYRDHGYRIEFASFRVLDDDSPYLGYYGRDGLPEYIRGAGFDAHGNVSESVYEGRDFWVDNVEDIIYCHNSMVLNMIKKEDIEGWLEKYLAQRPNNGFMRPMIHEQYYYPDYVGYIPDCGERVLCAIRYLYEHGYRGTAIEDVVLEK